MKNFFTLTALFFLLCSCKNDTDSLATIFSLPNSLKEVSGIIYHPATDLIWTLEDSGNKNEVYGLDSKGEIAKTIVIEDTDNIDWEDITKDGEGNLYIGDFGNNDNVRQDLCIYKINKNSLHQESAVPAYKISFTYPEQKDFPPKKTEMMYDVEGFFEFKNNFYLFTKNRSKGFDGTAFLYKIPNAPGFQQAVLMGEFNTCGSYNHCAITAATISPDETKIAILTHDKIFLLENFKGDHFLEGTQTILELNHFSQKEAVCFKNDDSLLIADERVKKTGGNVYEVSLSTLKSKP
jgi:hypothetical protein